MFIAEALRQNGSGHHVTIDPNERSRFDSLGLRHVDEAGLSSWVTFYEEPAELCLPRLVKEGTRIDIAFNDSGHLFDHVILEFVFLARLLRKGGVLVFDDAGLPAVERACGFIATNRRDFAEVLPSVAFDVDYRYFATTDTTFTSTNPDQIRSSYPTHNIVASVSWLFGP